MNRPAPAPISAWTRDNKKMGLRRMTGSRASHCPTLVLVRAGVALGWVETFAVALLVLVGAGVVMGWKVNNTYNQAGRGDINKGIWRNQPGNRPPTILPTTAVIRPNTRFKLKR